MRTKTNLIIAAVAAAALGLTACGGDTEPIETTAPTAEETQVEETPVEETPVEETPVEETPVEETPVEEDPPAEEPAGDFPYSDGDTIDPQEFTERLQAAMEGVDHMTIQSTVDGVETSNTQVDNSDPANPRSYSVTFAGEQKVEVVVEGETSWTRIDEGEWTEAPVDPSLGGNTVGSDTNYSTVELVSAADRQFRVGIDIGGSALEADLTVDEQFRPFLMAIDAGEMATVATYDYESPVEIPEVA